MDKHTGQRPFTDEELAQALRIGTDEAARRQSALRAGVLARAQAPERRRPLWHTLAASAAAVVLLVAALWALATRLPQWDVVQPLATNTSQSPVITLTTNIQAYTPALSSVQGITITARDRLGNPVSGSWKASWGVFLGPVSEQGNLVPIRGDYTDTLQDAARALWSFAPDAGDIPADITVTFTAPDGLTSTLHLIQDGENTGFVRVVHSSSSIRFRGKGFCINANPSLGGQVEPLVVEAVDQTGTPVNGTWSASFGTINAESGTVDNGSKVSWIFAAKTADDVPDCAQLFFASADGRCQVLKLTKAIENPFALAMTAQQAGEFMNDALDAAAENSSALRLRTDKSGVNADPSRNSMSQRILIKSEGNDTGPIRGTWTTSYGVLYFAEGRDISGTTVADADTVSWIFSAATAKEIPNTAEITFTAPDGRTKTLHLKKYPDQPWSLVIVPEELDYYPLEPSVTQPVATASAAPSMASIPAMNFDNVTSIELTREHTEVIPLTEVQQADLMSAINAGSTLGDDSIGTTPTYGATVTMKDGSIVRLWGPNQGIITYALSVDGKEVEQHNIVNQLLLQWFQNFMSATSSPSASADPSPTPDNTLKQKQANRMSEYLREFSAVPRGEAGFAQEYRGDWDGDGKKDHAYMSDSAADNATDDTVNPNGRFVTIAFGNGKRLTADAQDLEQMVSWGHSFLLQAADLNGDGKNEIILLIDLGGQGGRGSYGLYPYTHSSDGWKIMEAPYHGYTLALNWKDGKASVATGDYSETVADADMLQAHYSADHALDQWNQVLNTNYQNESAADIICDISLAKEGGRTVVKICQYTVGMTGVHVDGLGYLITTLSWDIQGKCTPSDMHFVLYPQ